MFALFSLFGDQIAKFPNFVRSIDECPNIKIALDFFRHVFSSMVRERDRLTFDYILWVVADKR